MLHSINFFVLLAVSIATACQPNSPTANTESVATRRQPAARIPTMPQPRYVGTYAVRDSTDCPLSITVTRQGPDYLFSCSNGSITRGKVEVSQEADATYFTFVGLKGDDPEEDVPALWQDTVLLIQNYGNSMNEYTRFSNCEAKYLELYRQ